MFTSNREIMYGIYQTKHHLNSVSGINGYFPVPRLLYQHRIEQLPDKNALLWLAKNGVTHIVFHKNMVIKKDHLTLKSLRQSSLLEPLFEDEQSVLFVLKE